MTKVAVILSGSGVMDGSEIHEAVLTLLALDQRGVDYQCMAPNMEQHHVINHLTEQEMNQESRNVLVESARIARGDILDLSEAQPENYDACVLPGGFGAAKNLCTFATEGAQMSVNKEVTRFIEGMRKQNKPIGFLCISPAMISKFYPKGVKMTLGNDQSMAQTMESLGCQHIECAVDDVVVDEANKVVTSPAYLLAQRISEAHKGIDKAVEKVLSLCNYSPRSQERR